MQPIPSILVLCDLDDTVFDPRTFRLNGTTAFDRIERERLPLVFCSSKTRAELELIQQELGINQPFISENGAAVFIPRGYFGFGAADVIDIAGYEVVEFGKPHTEVVASLHRAAGRLDIEVIGFSDMSVEDVAIECDVSLLQARLAKLREYNELFRVVDAKPGALPRLFKALRAAGLDCTSRGAYHHVGAVHRDLGIQWLRRLYRRAFGEVVTVAFGDHRGAAPLLRHADIPLVVQSRTAEETTHLLAAVPAARLTVADSVDAWAEVILDVAGAAQRSRSSCPS
ncbi:MAG: hypothetical protein ABJA98_11485 [Acidobacteriota bacterium]